MIIAQTLNLKETLMSELKDFCLACGASSFFLQGFESLAELKKFSIVEIQ